MENTLSSRLKKAWNAFTNKDPTIDFSNVGPSYSYRPDRLRLTRGNERSIINSIYNRIAMDVAGIEIKHCYLDDNGRYSEDVKSGLNECLRLEANIDQSSRSFLQDVVMSMLDEGCVAIVPVQASEKIMQSDSFDIYAMRTAKVTEWRPYHVKVLLYNELTGRREEILMPKTKVAIIENPLYSVVNEPNSTLQRLMRKLSLLDVTDEQTASGKLDLIIQLPYLVKTDARREQAERRRKDIEMQLSGSKYGIAYTDGTEKITQLNRSIENNLMGQVEYLTNMLFSQLGMTQAILDGTADEKTMLNYHTRTIEPIMSAITMEMKRKFLTKTARTQGQSIEAFRDPFKLVPVNNIAEIADKFTRNEILTSNEVRQIIGMKPSNDPKADELVNSNLNHPEDQTQGMEQPMTDDGSISDEDYNQQISELDNLDNELDSLEEELSHSDTIMHYASPYYDPVKAHEYYMKNRELSDRKSTSRLNEEGKIVAKQVKDSLNTERKGKVESHKNSTNSQIESARNEKKSVIDAHKQEMNKKIETLRATLSSMSKFEKAKNKELISNQIASLREANAKKREELQAQFQSTSSSLRETHRNERSRLKDEYDEKYVEELDKIKSEAQYLKPVKSKRSSRK